MTGSSGMNLLFGIRRDDPIDGLDDGLPFAAAGSSRTNEENIAAAPAADHGLWFLNSHVRVALPASGNADGISVLEHRMPFGDAPPAHVHHVEDEIFHILEGELRFRIGDRLVTGRAGDTLVAPRGIPHAFRVVSPEGARLLTIARGGFETVVRQASRPAHAAVLPEPAAPTPAMQAALAAICAAQRIELLSPPLR